ncbi:MAG: ABC transporter permease [Candidatus Aminicenantes bacterium]|jgi:putative ABC transport system permease protein
MVKRVEKAPLLPNVLLRLLLRGEDFHEFSDDIDEVYQQMIDCGPKFRAKAWYWFRVIECIPSLIMDKIYWRYTMIKNYLKIALRNFQRHKGYSLINIAGFAIGMACCLLIFLYVRHELSYDRYHKDVERVCRIVQDIRTKTANRVFVPVSPMVAPTLKSDYPQVEYAARAFTFTGSRLVRRKDTFFYESRFMYADQELFDVLTFQFIQGNQQGALIRPNTLVVSQRMAIKYFGSANPLGDTLEINQEEFEITGVVKDCQENTHLKYDLIASLETLKDWEEMSNWYSTMFYTYLKLRPDVNMQEFSKQVSPLADKYIGEQLESWGSTYHYFLQPVASIHLQSHLRYETEPPGNPVYITIFSFVGLFILIIACLNFMNLSTARAANRAKEVGLRKVVGAQKFQLIGQFLGESLLVAFLSLGLAMVIARFAIPLLNDLTGISLSFDALLMPGVLFSLIGGAVLVGMAAGLYPAFVLSAFRPAVTLKGVQRADSRGLALRTVLVVVQFAISVLLIIGTLTMYKQFNFMKNQYLGFEKEQKLILPLRGGIDIQENFASVKDMFSKHSSITGVTVSSTVPGRSVSNFAVSLVGEDDTKNQSMFHMYFDDDFIPNYGIEIVAGRAFQKEMKTDFMGAFLINEAAVKAFGWSRPEEALGKRVRTGHGGRVNPIIGVTKNFHYRGLQSEVEPLVMEFLPWIFRYITLSIDITDLNETLAFVKSQWKTLWPGYPFEQFFLDTDFDRQYRADEQIGNVFGIFTFLGLFIACLGLLGLASFTAESRIKEIGIRKVLGASVGGIVLMLSKQFTKWVLLANCIAWPVAYYFMDRWLKNFAFRIDIGIWTFVLSGVLVLLVALLTVSYQSIKAALANPVDSLRYE